MHSLTEKRLKEIMLYLNEHGEPATLKHYDFTLETLGRYKRIDRFESTRLPKVLLLDIETTFMIVRVWGLYKQRIPHDNVIKSWNCLSWSAKWLFSSETMSDVLTPEEAKKGDDKRIMLSMWKLLNDADIVIGHNADRFDLRRLNTRFIIHRIAPPMPYRVIDTLKVARKHFTFASNRLDYLGQLLLGRGKIKTNYDLWIKCTEGDQESLDYMVKYNIEDVALLEEVYVVLRPYIKSHPNMGIYQESQEPVCSNCGSVDIYEGGYYATSVGRYLAFRCKGCGAVCRSRVSDISKQERKALLSPIAR